MASSPSISESSPESWRSELLLFLKRLGAGPDAEDIVQETFLRWLSAPPATQPRAWLYRVALNVFRDRRRRERLDTSALRDHATAHAPADDPLASAERKNLAGVALEIVAKLPESQRLALLLRIGRQMDYDEIARVLECSVPTARQHFHLAVKAVRDRLLDDDHA